MKSFFLLILGLVSIQVTSNAQYYYRDILSGRQNAQEQQAYKTADISKIKLISIEEDGTETEGFSCIKKISRDFKKNVITSKTGITAETEMITYFNEQGNIYKTIDSSELSVGTNLYNYDAGGRLIGTSYFSRSHDDDFVNEMNETHLYTYDTEGHLQWMYKITNQKDTTRVSFKYDDSNNLAIEKDNRTGKIVYYYYDGQGRLTDIVHTFTNTQKMVVDYNFEYDENGRLIAMTSTEEGNGNYSIWHYFYDQELKSEDALYSKEGKLLGVVKYQYER